MDLSGFDASLHLFNRNKTETLIFEFWNYRIKDTCDIGAMPLAIVQVNDRAGDHCIEYLLEGPVDRLHPMRRDTIPHGGTVSPFREQG